VDRETTSSEKDRMTKLTANPTKEAALSLFVEQPIYEQSAARTVREQQEKRSCGWSRQPLKLNSWAAASLAAIAIAASSPFAAMSG
jgi:hypothetical protein